MLADVNRLTHHIVYTHNTLETCDMRIRLGCFNIATYVPRQLKDLGDSHRNDTQVFQCGRFLESTHLNLGLASMCEWVVLHTHVAVDGWSELKLYKSRTILHLHSCTLI